MGMWWKGWLDTAQRTEGPCCNNVAEVSWGCLGFPSPFKASWIQQKHVAGYSRTRGETCSSFSKARCSDHVICIETCPAEALPNTIKAAWGEPVNSELKALQAKHARQSCSLTNFDFNFSFHLFDHCRFRQTAHAMKKTLPTLFEQFKASNPKMPGLARGSGLAETELPAISFSFCSLLPFGSYSYDDMEGTDSVQHWHIEYHRILIEWIKIADWLSEYIWSGEDS